MLTCSGVVRARLHQGAPLAFVSDRLRTFTGAKTSTPRLGIVGGCWTLLWIRAWSPNSSCPGTVWREACGPECNNGELCEGPARCGWCVDCGWSSVGAWGGVSTTAGPTPSCTHVTPQSSSGVFLCAALVQAPHAAELVGSRSAGRPPAPPPVCLSTPCLVCLCTASTGRAAWADATPFPPRPGESTAAATAAAILDAPRAAVSATRDSSVYPRLRCRSAACQSTTARRAPAGAAVQLHPRVRDVPARMNVHFERARADSGGVRVAGHTVRSTMAYESK